MITVINSGIIIQPKFNPSASKRIKIGKNVNIGLGTVIGKTGFGYEQIENKHVLKPHDFGVVIEDDVDIGANCNIDTGRWRDTVIGEGTKIDSLVQIAHNVVIGKNCIIGTGAKILGSVTIGDNCFVWSNAVINQGVSIANGCTIGACSYLRSSINENETWFGVPAVKIE